MRANAVMSNREGDVVLFLAQVSAALLTFSLGLAGKRAFYGPQVVMCWETSLLTELCGFFLSIRKCRSDFHVLFKFMPSSSFMLCRFSPISVASLMSRLM
jgi:hypothetical protein